MEREILLTLLSFGLGGCAIWGTAALCAAIPQERGPSAALRHAWGRLAAPVLTALPVLTFLVGWALQEPDPADEWVGSSLLILATLSGLVVLRAIARDALAAYQTSDSFVQIGTVGLLRPRVVVSDRFRDEVSTRLLAAAVAHERAHLRARDPLRILLQRFVADLQWPLPGVSQRFQSWLLALELRRDWEAVRAGASALDLSEAILAAARYGHTPTSPLAPGAEGGGRGIQIRIRRLLGEVEPGTSGRWMVPQRLATCVAVLAAASGAAGYHFGEAVLRTLPGVHF